MKKFIKLIFNIVKFIVIWFLFLFIVNNIVNFFYPGEKMGTEASVLWFLLAVIVPLLISRKFKIFRYVTFLNIAFQILFQWSKTLGHS